MPLYWNGTLIPENVANTLSYNGTNITSVVYNGITVWTQQLYAGLWSGSTTWLQNNYAGWYTWGIETSGSTYRSGIRSYTSMYYGAWASVTGTSSPTFGTSKYVGDGYTWNSIGGVEGSGASIRFVSFNGFYNSYIQTVAYTPWATYTVGVGWSGGGSLSQKVYKDKYNYVIGQLYLDVSGTAVRWHGYNYVNWDSGHQYAPWATFS